MSKSSKNSFLMQGMILAAASIVCRVIGLLYRSPLFGIIGEEGMGYYSYAYNIYNIILLIASFSIPLAVSKSISARLAKREYINAQRIFYGALVYAIVVGGIASLIAYFGAPTFVGHQKGAALALQVISPTIFFSGILGVLRGYFQGHNTMVPTSISQIIEQILNAIFSILMAYVLILPYLPSKTITYEIARHGAAGSAIGTGVGVLTGLIFCFIIYRAYQPKVKIQMKHDRTKYIESYGNILKILLLTITPVIFSTAIYNCSATIDQTIFSNILVGKGITAKVVSGFYGLFSSQYNVLINVPVAMASALSNAIVPNVSAAYALGKKDDMNDSIQMAIRFTMMIAIPCAVGFITLAKPILNMLYFTQDNTTAALMLQMGALSVVFFCLSTVTNSVLQGLDDMMTPVKNAAISLVIHIVTLFLMLVVLKWNIYAVVLSKIIFSGAICVLNAKALRDRIGYVQEKKKTFVIPALASLIMGVIAVLVHLIFELFAGPYIATIIALLAAVVTYGVAIVVLGGITEEELLGMPKGATLVTLCRRLHLIKGEYR